MKRMRVPLIVIILAVLSAETGRPDGPGFDIVEYGVPAGSHPHDVAPSPDGTVWYTAQHTGELGRLDPATGSTRHIPLGPGSSPHGVIVGPDGAAWVTDSGLNAIVRVDPGSGKVSTYPLPKRRGNANLNTAAFDGRGNLWFTGQTGVYGRLYPRTGRVEVFDAPGGRGPYGIAATPDGSIYFVSLAGSYMARIDTSSGAATVIPPPTSRQGARRVWSDSKGRLWVSEWNAGQLGMYDPASGKWREWRLPGESPRAYAVYVDEKDRVWVTDFGSNAIVRFDPEGETFRSFPLPSRGASVRQMLGRKGEVWGAESGTDKLLVIRFPANGTSALDTGGMAVRSDTLFSSHGMKTRTVCTEERADITLFDGPDGKRPPVDKVIDILALVGKSFNREFGADYFYPMAVRYDGRTWIETLSGNCRDSFQDNVVSHCYYKVNF